MRPIGDWSMLMILSICSRPSMPVVGAGPQLRLVQAVGDRVVEDLVDQGRLARAGDAGDAAEDAERDVDVDPLEVVLAGAADDAARRVGSRRSAGHLDRALAGEVLAGQRGRVGLRSRSACPRRPRGRRARRRRGRGRRGGRRRASCPRRARRRSPCCRGRGAARAWRSASRCRAGAGRSRARRGCRARRPGWSRSGSRAGSAAPRRRRACAPSGPARGSRCRRCRGRRAAR